MSGSINNGEKIDSEYGQIYLSSRVSNGGIHIKAESLSNDYNKIESIQQKDHYLIMLREQKNLHSLTEIFNSIIMSGDVFQKAIQEIKKFLNFEDDHCIRLKFDDTIYFAGEKNSGEYSIFYNSQLNDTGSDYFQVFKLKKSGGSKDNDITYIMYLNIVCGLLKGAVTKYYSEKRLNSIFSELASNIEEKTSKLRDSNYRYSQINKDFTDSVLYARRIQNAIFPSTDMLRNCGDDSFVFSQPKDIIGGDFYWCMHDEQKSIVVSADCTGHGVPGALLSMVGYQILNNIVVNEKVFDPGKILVKMSKDLNKLLNSGKELGKIDDGMAISICFIDHKAQIIKYAGAGNPGYILSKGEFYLLGHEKFQIGSREFLNKYESSGMVNCIFEFQKGDKLYLFTDGFQDQFGGMDNKKLGKKKLLSMLKQNSNLPMCSQLDTLVGYFNEWMGDNEQVDDVTVLGIEL